LIGKTISHFKIGEKIGAGGMGEVYRAEELRLHRQVAVKVLPDLFAGDPERLARFEREAKLLASLNHQNIAAIYGLEEAEGKRFLAMELVEGETLAQRIKKGPLPVDETLEVCRQIAEGLEAAHEKSIVHRDLKPSNVKLTPEGKVKILDFGLAREFLDKSPVEFIADSPTITAEMTQPGVILGTAAYMSPEQAKGKPVDKRADIWAFGCILYECLIGKAAFPGETITEVLAAVLKGEPDWDALPKSLPANVRFILGRCLRKDRNLRYHDIADVRIELSDEAAYRAVSPTESQERRFPWIWIGAVVAALLAGVLIDRVFLKIPIPASSVSAIRTIVDVEPGLWLDGERTAIEMQRPSRPAMAISKDGSFIVYCASEETPGSPAKPRLFLRRMVQSRAEPILGTDGGINPFLSPDDRWAGFWADRKLKKIPIEGGVATFLCDAPSIYGVNWGNDGAIIFSDGWSTGLKWIPAEGESPTS
jgi:serine/threonine-protein kinase